MDVALSPCPNDTFLFCAWIHGKLPDAPPITATYADVEALNRWACLGTFPLTKLSFAAYPHVRKHYHFLPVGAVLGFGCGPKLIARHPMPLEEIKTVAIAGHLTTSHLLFTRLLNLNVEKIMCRYDQICPLVSRGDVDAGLIIHETRFTFAQYGCVELLDLGEVWETETGFPLPLGGIAIRHDVVDRKALCSALVASLRMAQHDPEQTWPFVRAHSQEKAPDVIQAHIDTYITSESLELSSRGIAAIEHLLNLPHEQWLA